MTLDGRQLSAFLAVVTHGSLGRAAEMLHITQPALSRIIKRLETQVGAPLFERNAKGMLLTAIGQALLPRATLMQREAEHAMEEINALRGLAKGTIKVGSIGSVASHILPLAVDRVLTRWPNLRVHIIEGVWDRLAEALIRHEIDLALGVAMPMPESEEIATITDCRWEDSSYVVASLTHPLRQQRKSTLADTLHHRWATMPEGTAPFEEMRHMFRSHGLPLPSVAVETRSIVVLKNLVANAGFLSWMSQPMYEAESKAGLIDSLTIPGVAASRSLTAFRRREGILPGPAARLLEELRHITSGPPRKRSGSSVE
ncbi:LysR family transcriptional regulator [Noviherbaspirillum cavernae]|uniref:LysR family transcriptional regulator n=1 Tax=Noviherbaspirillum cavernae TaxID=2320862 RepID=A0A418X378_9BURK|nr:LysR family transcriptional regulator [Noviherbaspirillum cavernae]RJG06899.1 LysR family transcriptional regulator [Noviherbaspirillum cavernae]